MLYGVWRFEISNRRGKAIYQLFRSAVQRTFLPVNVDFQIGEIIEYDGDDGVIEDYGDKKSLMFVGVFVSGDLWRELTTIFFYCYEYPLFNAMLGVEFTWRN